MGNILIKGVLSDGCRKDILLEGNVIVKISDSEESVAGNIVEEQNVADNLIDINSATVDELKKLDNIGDKKANAIIEMRKTMCGFRTAEDIRCTHGIGDKIYSGIRPYITAGEYKQ